MFTTAYCVQCKILRHLMISQLPVITDFQMCRVEDIIMIISYELTAVMTILVFRTGIK